MLDEIVLRISDHAKGKLMQEGAPLAVWQHGVGTNLVYEDVECIDVELDGGNVNARLAVEVSDEGMRAAELYETLDDKGVASKDGLVEGKFRAAVNAGPPLLKKKVKNVEVQIATCRE